MINTELSEALHRWYEANPLGRWEGRSTASPEEQFLAHYSSDPEHGRALLAQVKAVWDEARRVRDPGGPLGNYGAVMMEWAATRTDLDESALREITNRLIWSQR